jgi:hypothetical protein
MLISLTCAITVIAIIYDADFQRVKGRSPFLTVVC